VCVAVLSAVKSSVPTLTHVIPSQGRKAVNAVTSLDDDVFVVRFSSQHVEVYDAKTFTLQGHIAVQRLGSSTYGMTACARNKCLYLSDYENPSVHRVELSGSNAAKKWYVAKGPIGLSVNVAHNLVVVCRAANKIQEYTTHGSLVREICLQAGMTYPWHAIQLSTGDYVVSQWTSPGVVSVVGVDGQVIRSYGQSETSDVGQMKNPASLAVTKNDDILVADQSNHTASCQSTDQRAVYKNWLCQLMVEYDGHVVCVWTSHEVDFMSAKRGDKTECWSLMVLDCDDGVSRRDDV